MNTAIRAISLRLAGAATALLLSSCATLSPLSDVIIPNFSDEELGNPMAGYRPAGAVGAPVANRGAASTASVTAASSPRRTGLEFSATQSVRTTEARGSGATMSLSAAKPTTTESSPVASLAASGAVTASPALSTASTGLLDQAVSSGGVGLADAALLDAALDVSPSEMGAVGAASGLLGAETGEGSALEADGGGGNTFTATSAVSLLGITDVPGGGDASGSRASADGGGSGSAAGGGVQASGGMIASGGVQAGSGARAGSAPMVGSGDPAFTTLSAEDVAALLGSNPALDVVETSGVAAPLSAGPFAMATSTPALNEQAFIPVYGGNETLRVQPTPGEVSPGLARYRSGDLEVSLRFPASLALTQAYGAGAPTITLSLRNVGPTPVSLQPENLLTQFPPFEVYRWTGANWASLTLDVAYNLDRQGIAAPVTLQPGESTSRTELFGKVALLPLTVDLPPIDRLAIRLQIAGQGQAFARIDSGFIPITLTDG
ncbi:MAG: hypothetical protein VX077_05370, partial [Pseudomonadota bacterium]|nr:hypothetical protein [Pseudomonadota bacterium]